MHRNIYISIIIGAILLLTSCEKEGIGLYKGYYSFKTSGILTVEKQQEETQSEFKAVLANETGQMNIVEVDKSNMLVTMSIVGGDALVFEAEISEDKELILSPIDRIISIKDGALSVNMNLTISGIVKKYEDMIIIDYSYIGEGASLNSEYKVISSEVTTIAKENKK